MTIIPLSPYPVVDTPLRVISPLAVVISDTHIPYHNAPFINRVLDLAAAWGAKDLILAGDSMDLHSMSHFAPDFVAKAPFDASSILDVMMTENISKRQREKFVAILEKSGLLKTDNSVSGEVASMRQVFRALDAQFERVFFVLGNHEQRFIKRIEGILSADDLLNFVLPGMRQKWTTESMFYCLLTSAGQEFQIEHPGGTSAGEAEGLAAKFHRHIIMGHSHAWRIAHDVSGQYWAIQCGHCSDESRMSYAATRHTRRYAHCPGAVIVRDGYPFVLGESSPWELLKLMK